MSKVLGLRTAIYRVPEIKTGRDWYAKAFEAEPYFDEPFYVGFNIGGYELGVQAIESENHQYGDSPLVYWGVEDVEKTVTHFLSLGGTLYEAPQNVGGDILVAAVKDPWGNVIGLIYNPHFQLA